MIGKIEMQVAKYTLLVLATLVFAAAVARTIHYPINWANDLATFLFAWCVFLGGDIAIRENRLFSIVLVTGRLPFKVQQYINVVNFTIIGLFLIGMIGYGSLLSYLTRLRTFQGIPGFSYTWVTLSVPVGCALMLVTVIRKIIGFIRAIQQGAPAEKETRPTEVI
jgi:TRAP-type C4-dicarboxylate transport system permease small subunit